MGFRFHIPLPGPVVYSVGMPKVGRALSDLVRYNQDAPVCPCQRRCQCESQPEMKKPRKAPKPRIYSHEELTQQLAEMDARHAATNKKLRDAGVPLDEEIERLLRG